MHVQHKVLLHALTGVCCVYKSRVLLFVIDPCPHWLMALGVLEAVLEQPWEMHRVETHAFLRLVVYSITCFEFSMSI